MIALLAALAASCSRGPDAGADAGDGNLDDARPCRQTRLNDTGGHASGPAFIRLAGDGPARVAASIARATYACATDAVVVAHEEPRLVALAALLASHLGAPLLFGEGGSAALATYEIDRLGPMRVWMVGDTVPEIPAYAELVVIDGDMASIAARINSELGVPDDSVPLRGASAEGAARALVEALASGRGLDPTAAASPTSGRSLASGPGTSGRVWLVDHDDVSVAMAAVAAAESVDGLMAVVDGTDLRANAEAGRVLRMSEGGADIVHTIGVTDEASWQLPIILSGQELPGGGYLLFPGRRLVALYGNPVTDELGILGRQSLEESVAVARRMAQPYGADGVAVLPTFEIIATVAAAGPGGRGDYSNRMPADVIRPWIEAARSEGFYVVLDLQPGRSHFLDQAMEYEEFLLEPHVGLALDPEWRLAPDQVHLRQIGQVDAAEVNEVSAWLASLVRENALPQKLFLLHQFRSSMLQDRESIQTPPELAVVIQMDGQGTIPNKYATWDSLTRGWEEHAWQWGWKNFTIEDVPGPISPSEVLQLVPTPVFVSYQ